MEEAPTHPDRGTVPSRLRHLNDHFATSSNYSDDDDDLPLLLKTEPIFTRLDFLNLLLGAATEDPHGLLPRLRSAADSNPLHRRLFVFGPGLLDCTPQSLAAAFTPFGPVEDCSLVPDKANSPFAPSQGYGLVVFAAGSSARKALKRPERLINGRPTTCMLATVLMRPASDGTHGGRLVHIDNVPPDGPSTLPERLRPLLEAFGEIELGPQASGLYVDDEPTAKYLGPASVIYRTREGARKAVEEPYKMFEGRFIHCQPAALPAESTVLLPLEVVSAASRRRSPLAELAAEQNLALHTGEPGVAADLGALAERMASSQNSFFLKRGMAMGQPYTLEQVEASDDDDDPDSILHLLEPFSNEQLIGFLCEAAAANLGLRHRILTTAAHSSRPRRSVIIHGLPSNGGGGEECNRRLKSFFEEYGEVESGPRMITGRDGGSAKFVYRKKRAAEKAVEEAFKVFEGQQLLCLLASEDSPLDAAAEAAAEDMVRQWLESAEWGCGHG